MSATETATRWQISGDYFENCSCTVLCPCIITPQGPLMAQPTEGHCEVPLAFHIERGSFGDVSLDGLNVVVALRTPGVMAEGNAAVALYVDDRADEGQEGALTAIFSGGAGGPMGALAPLVATFHGVRKLPISYKQEGRRRSVEIPNVLSMAVSPVPGVNPDGDIVINGAHPLIPEGLACGIGEDGSVYEDYGMRWDNSGRNAHYARFTWSNA